MPFYRLFLLDLHTGHITGVEEIDAADDACAIRQARLRDHQVPLELWQGKRKVGRLDARPEAAAFI